MVGLQDVVMNSIRNGICVQSQPLRTIQRLTDTINEHANTKDVFVLRKATMRKPQFRLSGVGPDILPAEFSTTLRAQILDVQIEANEFNSRTTLKEKSGNCARIFDVTNEGYKKTRRQT